MDYFSKWAEAYALPNQKAFTVANAGGFETGVNVFILERTEGCTRGNSRRATIPFQRNHSLKVPVDYAPAHCVAEDVQMSRGIAVVFNKKFGQLQEQNPEVGGVLQLKKDQRNISYLVTIKHFRDKPSLTRLRDTMLDQKLVYLAMPKIAFGLDRLDWRILRSMKYATVHFQVT
ncbi:ADP-ribose glycohydrolase OARD1-like [Leptinotarsa decemlineata]|uniref:ADP-ribose glycohydrolase OARD1-like n=1 Tax=Leptinotarsa decemlineata TaxID=7539 RepID=UPI003D30462D